MTRIEIWKAISSVKVDLGKTVIADKPITHNLTNLEVEIISYVAQGFPAKQIARISGYAPQTVKNKMCEIKRLLNASSQSHAAAIAVALNIVDGESVLSQARLNATLREYPRLAERIHGYSKGK